MLSTRVIVVLTIVDDGLYRTRSFKSPSYVGDPLNAIRIFNDKEVDELLVLDISADRTPTETKRKLYSKMASQAFMPTSFGGGVTSIEQMKDLFYLGYDKIVMNTSAIDNPELVSEAAARYGSQSVAVSIDVDKNLFGREEVVADLGTRRTGLGAVEHAKRCEVIGAGEIIIRSVRHDGLLQGYDLELISKVAAAVSIPVVAAGGAGTVEDLEAAIAAGAQSVSAGSMFVYHGKHRAVLINYLGPEELERDTCVS